ncbi:MAG TPA: hypothetical protein VM869_06255 [Enhygromyxa sp.]|nr:hypothetical protein [Enhygromyxa sp.]
MSLLLLGLVLGSTQPEAPQIQRPGEPVLWAFEWDAPPECPSRADVIASVRSYLPELEQPPPSPSRADLRVSVSVAIEGQDWAATVRMSGRDGTSERRFSAPACVELAEATALITAVALDPVLVARHVTQQREAAEAASVEPQPARINPPTPAPAEPEALASNSSAAFVADNPEPLPPRTFQLGVGLFGTGAWGPATVGFGGLAGSFAMFANRWRWQLEGGWSIPRALTLDDGRRGRVQAWWLGTRGCVVPRLGPIELPSCPGIEAGQVFARGLPPTTNISSASQPWAAIVLGQGLRWLLHDRVALTVEAAVLVSLVRGRFRIGDQTLASITPVGFRGALGLEIRF